MQRQLADRQCVCIAIIVICHCYIGCRNTWWQTKRSSPYNNRAPIITSGSLVQQHLIVWHGKKLIMSTKWIVMHVSLIWRPKEEKKKITNLHNNSIQTLNFTPVALFSPCVRCQCLIRRFTNRKAFFCPPARHQMQRSFRRIYICILKCAKRFHFCAIK